MPLVRLSQDDGPRRSAAYERLGALAAAPYEDLGRRRGRGRAEGDRMWWRRVLDWAPVAVIVLLLVFSAHAFLYTLVVQHLLIPPSTTPQPQRTKALLYTLIYLFLLLNFLWNLTEACVRDPGYLLHRGARARGDNEDEEAVGMLESDGGEDGDDGGEDEWERKADGGRRFCRKCRVYKPDRTHHCSTCGRCVLKMDHHCPWIANRCVGFRNYKPFLLLLFYATLLCLFCGITSAIELASVLKHDTPTNVELAPIEWAFLDIAAFVLGMSLGGFCAWHIYLTLTNRTTIESLETDRSAHSRSPRFRPPPGATSSGEHQRPPSPPPRPGALLTPFEKRRLHALARVNIWDRGWRRNWTAVFGWDRTRARAGVGWWIWFVPLQTGSWRDGAHHPVDERRADDVRKIRGELDAYWAAQAARGAAGAGAGAGDTDQEREECGREWDDEADEEQWARLS